MKSISYFRIISQILSVICVFVFLIGCGFASSRTEVLGSTDGSGSGAGTPINTGNLKQIRIVDAAGNLFTSSSVSLSVGQSFGLKAALYSLGGVFQKDIEVYWSLKTLSGGMTTGLSCIGTAVAQCTFVPTMIGSVIVEATYVGSDSDIILVNAVSPVLLVSSLTTPASMDIHSGNLQRAVVNTDTINPLKVIVKDSFGQPIPGAGVNFAVTGGGGSVNPAAITTDVNGVAQTVLRVGTTAGNLNNLVTASVASNPGISQNFQVSTDAGSASHLVFSTQPAGSYSLLLLQAQPIVELKDIYGNTVPSNANIVMSLQTGAGVLGGTTTRAMVNGIATYNDLTYSIVESGIILRATSGAMTVDSVPFNVITSGGSVDRDPNDVVFDMSVSYVAGAPGRQTSNSVPIAGLGVLIDISVSGAGNPRLKLNGGPEVTSLSSVNSGVNLEVVADAPTVLGTKNTITVYMGSRIESWEVAYADSARVAPVFVTNGNFNGSRGGIAGIDGTCQAAATSAGLGGNWVSLQGDSSAGPKQRIPWNFGTVKRLDGVTIATSWQDLWDGTWAAPINVTELQTVKNANVWWGGLANGNLGGSHCFGGGGSWTGSTGFTGSYTSSSNSGVSISTIDCSNTYAFFCIGDSSAAADTDPVDIDFLGDVSYTSGTRVSSNTVTITGINIAIPVSVSGASGTPRLKINGGAEVVSGTASLGDTIQLVMDAPTVLGTQNTASVTLGADSKSWWVGYADNSKTARIFVTRGGYTANVGSSGAYDLACQSSATVAGHSGTWKALLADTSSGGGVRNRIPYDWGTLKRMDGQTVATSWQDLWDGVISNPINIDEYGEIKSDSVWTGSRSDGAVELANGGTTCVNWSVTGGLMTSIGVSSSTGTAWINSGNTGCSSATARAVYCIESTSLVDTSPILVPSAFYMKVAYAAGAGGRTASNVVQVRGVSSSVSVSIAGPGSPTFKINGGAEVTTGTVNWNDTLQIVMDAPAVFGTKNTAIVTIGSSSFNFNVGYADSARVVRTFVTSATYMGNINSTGGPHLLCNSLATAAGYSGQWNSIFTTSAGFPLRDHMVFNWGTLKRVDGATVATNWDDLWDGSLQNPISIDENGNTVVGNVRTGGTLEGQYNPSSNCLDYTSTSGSIQSEYGTITAASQWLSNTATLTCTSPARLYCIEDTISEDTTPNPLVFKYLTYQNVSTRVSSQTVTVTGITSSATVTLTGAQGNPAFKINGGAEVTSGSVVNGDTLTLVMDTPGALNQSHKLEIQVGAGSIVPWRVWTGNPASGVRKRVFITSTVQNGNFGGVVGADTVCQTRANTNAGLSAATWKAMLSGEKSIETDWAINRIGYAGAEIWSINADGTTRSKVINGSALWSSPHVLDSRIEYTEAGTLLAGANVWTGTGANGMGNSTSACTQWTSPSTGLTSEQGINSSSSDGFISNGAIGCNNNYRFYCIEQ